MTDTADETRREEAYCPFCGTTRECIVTVEWQDDTCTECGNPVADPGD